MKHAHYIATLVLAVALLPSVARTQSNADWSVYGGDTRNTRYSSLKQMNTDNVQQLRVAWVLQLGTLRSPIPIRGSLSGTTNLPRMMPGTTMG